MKPLPGWDERLERAPDEPVAPRYNCPLKKTTDYYSREIKFIDTQEAAHEMVVFAQQRPLAFIGIDTEFRYLKPGVVIDKNTTVYDPRSIQPLLLSLALVETDSSDTGIIYPVVVDLRKPELLPEIQRLFQLPVCFVGHYLTVELFCFWQLGLGEVSTLWDTYIAEKARYLGFNHPRYKKKKITDIAEEVQAKTEVKAQENFSLSLVVTCQRYGVHYSMEGAKSRLQQSFLDHPEGQSFTVEQIEYSAEDAIAAARLYPLQMQEMAQGGLLQHLIGIEMPWVRTNARMIWNGFKVDTGKTLQLKQGCEQRIAQLEQQFAQLGISNGNSPAQLKAFLEARVVFLSISGKGIHTVLIKTRLKSTGTYTQLLIFSVNYEKHGIIYPTSC